jgi:hypothetical protein
MGGPSYYCKYGSYGKYVVEVGHHIVRVVKNNVNG